MSTEDRLRPTVPARPCPVRPTSPSPSLWTPKAAALVSALAAALAMLECWCYRLTHSAEGPQTSVLESPPVMGASPPVMSACFTLLAPVPAASASAAPRARRSPRRPTPVSDTVDPWGRR